jgi:hypothetical protein
MLRAEWTVFEFRFKLAAKKNSVFLVREITNNPRNTLKKFWKIIGIAIVKLLKKLEKTVRKP